MKGVSMAKKRRFTSDTLKKIETFLDEYKKNPKQLVEPLCNQLHLGKSMLYDYLRDHKMSLAQIRETALINSTAPAKPIIKNEDKIMTNDALTMADIKDKIKKIDAIREDGFNLKDALKKSKTEITASQYYYYNKTQRPKTKKVASSRPTIPHTIEYIKETPNPKEPKKKQELLMMLGSPEALLEFVKKLQGG
jgi:hypothetical protein